MKPERLAALVSVLGVVLTTASVIASIAQYRAADLQARAAVVALMPQIEVRALLEKVDSDKFTDRRIEITSDGGPIYNLQIDRRTWIELRVGRAVVYEQPLTGYYFAEFPTGRTKGALTTIKGYSNNQDFIAFLEWLRPALGAEVEVPEPISLLRISFRDALKQDNVEYVQVAGGSETHMSVEIGQKLWDRHLEDEKAKLHVDISVLDSEAKAAKWVAIWKARIREYRK